MSGDLFKKYYKRLNQESILKATLCGLTISFSLLAILAALFWFMGWESFWICLIVWACVSVAAVLCLYKWKFQPTTKAIARRVDELGLEERVITMTELEGDESYIAMRQREDTLKALNTVNAGLIKLVVSIPVIVGIAISSFFGIGMITVSALSASDVLPSGMELIEQSKEQETDSEFEILYDIQEGEGFIEGDLSQVVQKGCDGSGVVAIPDEDWVFIGWSDGLQNPYRQETNVQFDITVRAIFLPIDDVLDGEEDAEKDSKPEGEPDPNAPKEEKPVNKPSASTKYEEANQIYDGNTYYGDEYEEAAENTREELTKGEYTEEQKEMVGGYLDGIETIVDEENE